ncbi:HNH endonuclease [Aliarcobacter skirrowii]|uniref:HNH endonuclease n=1 Tax=Aliarcobacter skirrowii TaxID=28200 RepID=UPI0029B00E63|nr:HNH endonuclease [Aliarcobacter skirrowii]MDX4058533.1 HNH endonuclease [Aliarcobacter skirrowii]
MIKKIKSLFSKSDDLEKYEIFVNLLKNYLKNYYPKILFDFSNKNILKKEFNLDLQKSFLIESLIKQFIEFDYKKITQNSVKRELTWEGYGLNSTPNKKVPNDFIKRKELVFYRDKSTCNRCGTVMERLSQASFCFVQEIEDGGGYNIENIILLCSSCNQVVNNFKENYNEMELIFRDKLYEFIS